MRVFTPQFALGVALFASMFMVPATADAGLFRRRAASNSCGCGSGGMGYGGYSGYGGYGGMRSMGYGGMGYGGYGGTSYYPGSYGYGGSSYYPGTGYAYGGNSYYPGTTYPYGMTNSYPGGYAYGGTGYYSPYGTTSYYTPSTYLPSGLAPAGYATPSTTGTANGTTTVPNNLPSRTTTAAETVSIKDGSYDPATVTINAGQTVKWKNDGKETHTVTSSKGDWGSNDLAPGHEFTATYTLPGTFEYYCRFHPNMKGKVIVK
jgi:plastocyanin